MNSDSVVETGGVAHVCASLLVVLCKAGEGLKQRVRYCSCWDKLSSPTERRRRRERDRERERETEMTMLRNSVSVSASVV